jgi:putative oxidoreductase
MTPKPKLYLPAALLILRGAIPLFFMAHALVRIVAGTIPGFGGFLESLGFSHGVLLVWLITLYELGAGAGIALGIGVRWLVPGLLFIVSMGIVLIHFQLGWFVGEHGTGGMEYSFALIVGLLVLWAHDVDHVRQARSASPI